MIDLDIKLTKVVHLIYKGKLHIIEKNIKEDFTKWEITKLLVGSFKSMKMAIFPKPIKRNSNENPNNIFHGTWQANSNIEMEE